MAEIYTPDVDVTSELISKHLVAFIGWQGIGPEFSPDTKYADQVYAMELGDVAITASAHLIARPYAVTVPHRRFEQHTHTISRHIGYSVVSIMRAAWREDYAVDSFTPHANALTRFVRLQASHPKTPEGLRYQCSHFLDKHG